jgi:hypothetical protein
MIAPRQLQVDRSTQSKSQNKENFPLLLWLLFRTKTRPSQKPPEAENLSKRDKSQKRLKFILRFIILIEIIYLSLNLFYNKFFYLNGFAEVFL